MKKHAKQPDWELEEPFSHIPTLDELINEQPFKTASDEHGHSFTAATRIPHWMLRRVEHLRQMKGSPYMLVSDVLRDAVYLGLRIQQVRYGRHTADWDAEVQMAQVVESTGASRRIRAQIEELEAGLQEMCKDGDYDRAVKHLMEYIEPASNIGNEWQKRKIFTLIKESAIMKELLLKCLPATQKLIGEYAERQQQLKGGKDDKDI